MTTDYSLTWVLWWRFISMSAAERQASTGSEDLLHTHLSHEAPANLVRSAVLRFLRHAKEMPNSSAEYGSTTTQSLTCRTVWTHTVSVKVSYKW